MFPGRCFVLFEDGLVLYRCVVGGTAVLHGSCVGCCLGIDGVVVSRACGLDFGGGRDVMPEWCSVGAWGLPWGSLIGSGEWGCCLVLLVLWGLHPGGGGATPRVGGRQLPLPPPPRWGPSANS